jgi:hypothetical protein
MKVGKTGLKMSSGEIRHFKSEKARNNFERVAQAYKHGWRPKGKKGVSSKHSPMLKKRHGYLCKD